MSTPRAYTEDEVIQILMHQIHNIVDYWANESRAETAQDKCKGVAHSILAMLDGSNLDIPAFNLVACPHEEDKQFCIDNEENWYEPDMVICTALHEQFHRYNPKHNVPAAEHSVEVERKYVKVMADYCSTGLWNKDGINMDVAFYTLSPPTVNALRDWCLWYEKNDDYMPEGQRKRPPFDIEAFATEGLRVAKMIKADLPDYTVMYFDELLLDRLGQVEDRRYEYEV